MTINRNLAIDIDGVVFPSVEAFEKAIRDKYGICDLPKPKKYSLHQSWCHLGVTREMTMGALEHLFIDNAVQTHLDWDPCTGSVDALAELAKIGYEIYFLTARSYIQELADANQYRELVEVTNNWIEKHFPFAKDVLYETDKGKYANDFLCLLEDRGKLCKEWQEAGGQAIMYRRSYNVDYHADDFLIFNGWTKDNLIDYIEKVEKRSKESN